jgi:hypothetical protein
MAAHSVEWCKDLMDRSKLASPLAPPICDSMHGVLQHRYLNFINFLIIPTIVDTGIVCPF